MYIDVTRQHVVEHKILGTSSCTCAIDRLSGPPQAAVPVGFTGAHHGINQPRFYWVCEIPIHVTNYASGAQELWRLQELEREEDVKTMRRKAEIPKQKEDLMKKAKEEAEKKKAEEERKKKEEEEERRRKEEEEDRRRKEEEEGRRRMEEKRKAEEEKKKLDMENAKKQQQMEEEEAKKKAREMEEEARKKSEEEKILREHQAQVQESKRRMEEMAKMEMDRKTIAGVIAPKAPPTSTMAPKRKASPTWTSQTSKSPKKRETNDHYNPTPPTTQAPQPESSSDDESILDAERTPDARIVRNAQIASNSNAARTLIKIEMKKMDTVMKRIKEDYEELEDTRGRLGYILLNLGEE